MASVVRPPQEDYCIRQMTREEMDLVVSWAADEGWNPGLHDAECFYNTDPKGYFVGELDGKIVAAISAVAYDDTFAFGGFYIVLPEYRDKGLGLELFQKAMEYVGDRNFGGDGVVEQQENYKKSGLVLAYRNIRYEGQGGGECPAGVFSLSEMPFEKVLAYDTRHFPVPRERFLRCWLALPNAVALGVEEDGQLAGYGVVRSCVRGYKIGPLFADTAGHAETLFAALASHAPNGPLYLDVPEPNASAVSLAERHGMTPVFETARMYTKGAPAVPLDEVYGVTSFELG